PRPSQSSPCSNPASTPSPLTSQSTSCAPSAPGESRRAHASCAVDAASRSSPSRRPTRTASSSRPPRRPTSYRLDPVQQVTTTCLQQAGLSLITYSRPLAAGDTDLLRTTKIAEKQAFLALN